MPSWQPGPVRAKYTFTFVGAVLTIQQAASSATLMSSSDSLYVTQAATLTATVSVIGSGGAPSGTVNFMLGPTLLGTSALIATDGTDATATMQLIGSQLTTGPNSITAVYSGDSNYSGSTSLPITVTLLSSGLSFGTVNVGTAAPVQTLTYTFNNDATLSAINILTQAVTGLDYTDGGSSTCAVGMPYTMGQSCTVTVAFNPEAPGERAGAVTLFADGSNLPLVTWYVTGIGESAAVTIDPGTQTTLASIASALTFGSAIDGAGNVYVADNTNGQVIMVAAGTLVQSTVIDGLALPTSVALDGAGNLYVAESSGVIVVPNENGTLNSADVVQVNIDGLGLPQGIALDGNGNLYVTDSTNGAVLQVPVGGGAPVTVVSGLTNPHAVAVDPAGDVYVASDNQVSEYPSGGGTVPLGSGYNSPQGIVADASGTVYVADTGNDQIVEVSAGGGSQSVLAVAGIMAPHGVTIDAAGNLYISDGASVYEVNRTQAAALNFGSQSVGSTSPAQTLRVSNAGNQQLTVSSLSIPANFTQQPSGGTDCSSTSQLVVGHACAIAAAFAPTTTGVLNGTLTLTDNALNNPAAMQSVGMSGTKANSAVTVLRSPLSAASACSVGMRLSDALAAGDRAEAGCASAATSPAPQSPQNLSPGSAGAPQEGQTSFSGWPHWTQNFRPSRLSLPQLEQRIDFPPGPSSRPSFIIQPAERLSRFSGSAAATVAGPRRCISNSTRGRPSAASQCVVGLALAEPTRVINARGGVRFRSDLSYFARRPD